MTEFLRGAVNKIPPRRLKEFSTDELGHNAPPNVIRRHRLDLTLIKNK